jgi:hypothetical protein
MGVMAMTMDIVMVIVMTTIIIVMMDIPDLITGAITMGPGVDQDTDLFVGGEITG